MQLMIIKGEKSDFEAQISQLESRELATKQQVKVLKNKVEELVRKIESLAKKLELEDKRKKDITLFCDRSYKI